MFLEGIVVGRENITIFKLKFDVTVIYVFTEKVYEKGERTIKNGLGNFSVSCKSLMHRLVSFAIIPCFKFLLKFIILILL